MFFGREKELKEINEALNSSRFESILISGRRRVGKTYLICEAIKLNARQALFFECHKSSLNTNLMLFQKKIQKITNNSHLNFENFNDVFQFLFKYASDNNFILIIDEFSFLLSEDFSIESDLAACIDEYKENSSLKIIISGSYVGLINKMIDYNAHSYSRYNHIITIRPFNYYESSLFYPNYSNEDKLLMYAAFGGLPYFNSLIDNEKTAEENIETLIIRKDSIIEHEIESLVLSEAKKITTMFDILLLLGNNITKYSDIALNLSLGNNSKPDYFLERLLDMDLISKEVPINDKNNKKRTLYRIKDNAVRFYFTYLFAHPYSELRASPQDFYEEFIHNHLKSIYLPKVFEDVSKEFLFKSSIEHRINPLIYEVGTYSFNDAKNKMNRQFDVVTKDKIGYITYECKYTNSIVEQKIINEEETQIKNLDIEFYKLGFISKNGFSEDIDKAKYNLFTLDDFYI